MSGDLWQMARNGTTLLPSEVKKLAADYDRLRRILGALREPSEAVMVGAFSAGAVWDVVTHTRKTIQLAVAAAEQEADQ